MDIPFNNAGVMACPYSKSARDEPGLGRMPWLTRMKDRELRSKDDSEMDFNFVDDRNLQLCSPNVRPELPLCLNLVSIARLPNEPPQVIRCLALPQSASSYPLEAHL